MRTAPTADNEVYDGYVAQLQAGISGQEREEVLRLAEQELFNTCPILPVYSYTTLRLVKPYVKGFQVNLRRTRQLRIRLRGEVISPTGGSAKPVPFFVPAHSPFVGSSYSI